MRSPASDPHRSSAWIARVLCHHDISHLEASSTNLPDLPVFSYVFSLDFCFISQMTHFHRNSWDLLLRHCAISLFIKVLQPTCFGKSQWIPSMEIKEKTMGPSNQCVHIPQQTLAFTPSNTVNMVSEHVPKFAVTSGISQLQANSPGQLMFAMVSGCSESSGIVVRKLATILGRSRLLVLAKGFLMSCQFVSACSKFGVLLVGDFWDLKSGAWRCEFSWANLANRKAFICENLPWQFGVTQNPSHLHQLNDYRFQKLPDFPIHLFPRQGTGHRAHFRTHPRRHPPVPKETTLVTLVLWVRVMLKGFFLLSSQGWIFVLFSFKKSKFAKSTMLLNQRTNLSRCSKLLPCAPLLGWESRVDSTSWEKSEKSRVLVDEIFKFHAKHSKHSNSLLTNNLHWALAFFTFVCN